MQFTPHTLPVWVRSLTSVLAENLGHANKVIDPNVISYKRAVVAGKLLRLGNKYKYDRSFFTMQWRGGNDRLKTSVGQCKQLLEVHTTDGWTTQVAKVDWYEMDNLQTSSNLKKLVKVPTSAEGEYKPWCFLDSIDRNEVCLLQRKGGVAGRRGYWLLDLKGSWNLTERGRGLHFPN